MQIEKKGPLLEESQYAQIYEGYPNNFYETKFIEFSKEDFSLIRKLEAQLSRLSYYQKIKGTIPSAIEKEKIIKDIHGFLVGEKVPKDFAYKAYCHLFGLQQLSMALEDPDLEEIMVNSDKQIFVFHKKHGMCKSNLDFEAHDLESLIKKIARTINKPFDEKNPLLDARLPDGSRVNATFSYVTPRGHTLTIRKFATEPFSIIDLINKRTLDSDLAAFLWLCTEGMQEFPLNILVIGGASTGKTTLLNSLATFIPYSQRIVSIEDTLEIVLNRERNLVQMESRPKTFESREISMDDLLRNALRMRPDRLIIGEVRGEEASTLFNAMNVGHQGVLGTLHANNAKEMILRLKSEPMSVPESLIPLIDIVIVMNKHYYKGVGVIRKVYGVSEISRMDNKPLTANLYEWVPVKSKLERTQIPSEAMEKLANATGTTKKELFEEIQRRTMLLEWMKEKQINAIKDVEEIIQTYYLNPEKLLEEVRKSSEALHQKLLEE
jgi:flagellar protein FlaI